MSVRHDLIVRQGETFAYTWTKRTSAGVAVDISGYTARMSVKPCLGGAAEAYLSSGDDADGGTITLGGVAGTVALAMTAAETAALADAVTGFVEDVCAVCGPKVVFIYDLELESAAGVVTRELEGRFVIWRGVTQ